MQKRCSYLFAYFFIATSLCAQQYPFVHYSQKDGLISNRIRNIYQDSKGRLYFSSLSGLSVYDGARFTNYTAENGLPTSTINCVQEMGPDSVWIVTNSPIIHCLHNGKLKLVRLEGNPPTIDKLLRIDEHTTYAGSEQGIFELKGNRLTRLPLVDLYGRDINSYIGVILPAANYLLIQRDYGLLHNKDKYTLYLYDPLARKVIAQFPANLENDV